MYDRITASSRPTVETKYPLAQKCCPTKVALPFAVDPSQMDHVVDNVAQAASDFVLIVSCEELRLRGGRANAAGLKPSSRPGLARPVEEGGDNDPAAAQAWPTAQPRGGL